MRTRESGNGTHVRVGNQAWLVGCPARDVAARYRLAEIRTAMGPELEAQYRIPLFWLACFDATDAPTTHEPDDPQAGNPDRDFIVLCAPASDFLYCMDDG